MFLASTTIRRGFLERGARLLCVAVLASCTAGQVGWNYPAPAVSDVKLAAGSSNQNEVALYIYGTGFLPGVQVYVGQTACSSVQVISSTELLCSFPALVPITQNEAVKVVNADQQSSTGVLGALPQLVLTASGGQITAGTCATMTLSYQNNDGSLAQSPGLNASLSSDAGSVVKFFDPTCGSPISSVTLPAGGSSASFGFQVQNMGTTATSLLTNIRAFNSAVLPATLSVTFVSGSAHTLKISALQTGGAQTVGNQICTPFMVSVVDSYGNSTTPPANLTVTVNAAPGGGTLSAQLWNSGGAGCPSGASAVPATVSISSTQTSANFYFMDPKPSLTNLSASAVSGSGSSLSTTSAVTITSEPIWAWTGGDTVADVSTTTTKLGARGGAVGWVSGPNGQLFLFGGRALETATDVNPNPVLSDLWSFDGTGWSLVPNANGLNTVTLGQPGSYSAGPSATLAATNWPGGRSGALALGASSSAWVFGGAGCAEAGTNPGDGCGHRLNDLWHFYGGQWAWIAGEKTGDAPGSYASAPYEPVARDGASGGVYLSTSVTLYVFGGETGPLGGAGVYLNDLWTIAPNGTPLTWTLDFRGAGAGGQVSNYGGGGAYPGGRRDAATWVDTQGQLWVFGGYGYLDSTTNLGPLNDLWVYSFTNHTWSLKSTNAPQTPASYGSVDQPATSNVPGPRFGALAWVDPSNPYGFWLYGGQGKDASGTDGELSDLWYLDQTSAKWTWVGGSSSANTVGVYSSSSFVSANAPGSRDLPVGWALKNRPGVPQSNTPAQPQLWMFGGHGYDSTSLSTNPLLSDVWALLF